MVDRTGKPSLTRRGLVAALAGSSLAAPLAARAQVVSPPQAPPIAPPLTPAPAPVPVPPPVATVPRLTPSPIDKTKIYYVFFDQGIDLNTMKGLRQQLTVLVEAGVAQIVLVINSVGGQTLEALNTYSFIRSLPVRVDTHAQSFVASAATLLFLAGEERSADHAARFLFHPTQTNFTGFANQQQIQDRMVQLATIEGSMAQIYRDRTTLTEEQVRSFTHGEIFFTADQAHDAGIVQTVADLKLPGGQTAKILFLD